MKIFNKNIADGVDYTLDAATLAASFGSITALKNLSKLRKVWLAYEILSSGTSLLINAQDYDERTEYKQAVAAFQIIQGISGISELGYNTFKNPKLVLSSFANAPGKFLSMSSQITQQTMYNCLNAIENLESMIKKGAVFTGDAQKTCDLLIGFKKKMIEDWPRLFGKAFDVSKLASLAVVKYEKTFNWLKGVTNNNIASYGKTDFIIGTKKIGHVDGEKILMIDEIVPSSTDGTVMSILEGGTYRKVGSTADETGDLMLIRKSDGTYACIEGACFVAGTLIHTNKGLKKIENIVEKDSVWAYSSKIGGMILSSVSRTFRKSSQKLVRLITDRDTIMATPEHPFFSEEGWNSAEVLTKGKKLKLAAGMWATLLAIHPIDTQATVYNFEVKDIHTYCVGHSGLIVHNSCSDANDLLKAGYNAEVLDDLTRHADILKKASSLNKKLETLSEIKSWFITGLPHDLIAKLDNLTESQLSLLNLDFQNSSVLKNAFKSDNKLLDSWQALSGFSTLRIDIGNLQVLSKVSNKFSYNGITGFAGLKEVFSGHKSAQKFIENLGISDELFGEIDGLFYSAIKISGEVRINSKEVIVCNIFDKKVTVDDLGWIDDLIDVKESKVFPNKYEVYSLNGDIFTGELKVVHLNNGEVGFYYLNKNNIPYINGYTSAKLKRIPKTNPRPDPNTYLPQDYLVSHNKQFEDEGGAFIFTLEDISDPQYKCFNPKKYVMLKSDMDKIIADFKASGDVSILEIGLGYEKNSLKGKEIFVKYIEHPIVKMPDGNEGGANKFWEPGGKTSGGQREAVLNSSLYMILNSSNPIFHNNDISNLKDIVKIQ